MSIFSIEEQTAAAYRNAATPPKPVVGLTANYDDEHNARLADAYYKQVAAAGATPVIIPPLADADAIMRTLDRIDALLLTGGADINPLYQDEQPSPLLGGVNHERDLPELLITRMAANRQMPILGICRGMQTLAMAMGGKVAQDLSLAERNTDDSRHTACIKHSQQAARHVPTHTVEISRGTMLYEIFKECFDKTSGCKYTLFVNSFHHQAVSSAGSHLKVSATAPDGIIEAMESCEGKPLLAVQWHPECMGDDGQPLFRWLTTQATAYRKAQQLHDTMLTLDTHCDTPMLFPQGIDFATRDSRILVDLPKMTEGRLDATIMVAYIPQKATPELPGEQQLSPFGYANAIFDRIERIAEQNAARLAMARTPDDLWRNKRNGRKSIMIGIENGKALEGDIKKVEHFANRGVVYITLCHNGDNDICDSAKGQKTHGGVSTFGRDVIAEMNRLGIMVDLSHAAQSSFYDALDISKTPIVCSHSSCRALCDHPRNLTDEQMKALAKAGGVCQITLYPGFLNLNPAQADIYEAMRHLEHAISIMGVEHVGLGTDFDGDGGIPGLADASELTLFTRQLMERRFNPDDIQKIWGGNFLRVMHTVQNYKGQQTLNDE